MPPISFEPGTLAVLVGVSGSGKSTFASQYPHSWRVCLDDLREWATDNAADQSATPFASRVQDLLLDARLARGLITVVDSTNVLPHVRAGLLARARHWQRPAVAVLFDLPLAACQRRNSARSRVVPAEVLRQQHRNLPSREQLAAEGFAQVLLPPAHAAAS
jgi:predicted kinase